MAWKRSRVRIPPGPPNLSKAYHSSFLSELPGSPDPVALPGLERLEQRNSLLPFGIPHPGTQPGHAPLRVLLRNLPFSIRADNDCCSENNGRRPSVDPAGAGTRWLPISGKSLARIGADCPDFAEFLGLALAGLVLAKSLIPRQVPGYSRLLVCPGLSGFRLFCCASVFCQDR